jgi:hypothetical protein
MIACLFSEWLDVGIVLFGYGRKICIFQIFFPYFSTIKVEV